MKKNRQGGFSFFKLMVIMMFVVLVLCIAVPSIKTMAGQSGASACEHNIKTITRLEGEYYRQIGEHTPEYTNLGIVDENSTLYMTGLLSKEDIECASTGGVYQWQIVDGETVLVCTGH